MRWLLWLALLAIAGAVFCAVPVGGRTLLQRVQGVVDRKPAPAAAPSVVAPRPAPSDRLTDDDRRKLDDLIESKLKELPRSGAGKP